MATILLAIVVLGLAIHGVIRASGFMAHGSRRHILAMICGGILVASIATVLLVKGEATAFALIG